MFEELPENHRRVVSLIGYGKEQATQVSYISKLTGLSGATVRAIVAEAVVKYGMPIGTCNNLRRSGLYIISNDEEKNDTVRNLKSRARKILQRANAISKMPSQDQERMLL
jgi:hypothetical protein